MQPPNFTWSLIDVSRQQTLLGELSFAWKRTPVGDIKNLSINILATFPKVTWRRAENLSGVITSLGKRAVFETKDGFAAYRNGEFGRHVKKRGQAAWQYSEEVIESSLAMLATLRQGLKTDAGKTVPELVVGTLAFIAASGGPDANGGIPDLDLAIGIGAHRSIFTHSIISGAILETGLFAIAEVISLLYQHLPPGADPIWKVIAENKDRFLNAAAMGGSAGISYHLLVDGTVQAAPYHDLPIALSMGGHQTILIANGGAELIDIRHKGKTFDVCTRRIDLAGPEKNSITLDLGNKLKRLINPSSDRLIAVLIFYLWIAEHSVFRARRQVLPENIKRCLDAEQIQIIETYGYWMTALVEGRLLPYSDDQQNFISVALGKKMPSSAFEHAWLDYKKAVGFLDIKR